MLKFHYLLNAWETLKRRPSNYTILCVECLSIDIQTKNLTVVLKYKQLEAM